MQRLEVSVGCDGALIPSATLSQSVYNKVARYLLSGYVHQLISINWRMQTHLRR